MPDHRFANCTGYWQIRTAPPRLECTRCDALWCAEPEDILAALVENHHTLLLAKLTGEGAHLLAGRRAESGPRWLRTPPG